MKTLKLLRYQTGEKIRKGDRVLFHREPGQIELVAVDENDAEASWYIQEFGGAVMIIDAVAGRTFIRADQIADYKDLEFISRIEST